MTYFYTNRSLKSAQNQRNIPRIVHRTKPFVCIAVDRHEYIIKPSNTSFSDTDLKRLRLHSDQRYDSFPSYLKRLFLRRVTSNTHDWRGSNLRKSCCVVKLSSSSWREPDISGENGESSRNDVIYRRHKIGNSSIFRIEYD